MENAPLNMESSLVKMNKMLAPLSLGLAVFIAEPAVARTTAFDTTYIEQCAATITDPKCGPAMRSTLKDISKKLHDLQGDSSDRAEIALLNPNTPLREVCMRAAKILSQNMKHTQSVWGYMARNHDKWSQKPNLRKILDQVKTSQGFRKAYPHGGDREVVEYVTTYLKTTGDLVKECEKVPSDTLVGIGTIFSKKARDGVAKVRDMQVYAPATLAEIIETFEADPDVEKDPAAWSALIFLKAMRPPVR